MNGAKPPDGVWRAGDHMALIYGDDGIDDTIDSGIDGNDTAFRETIYLMASAEYTFLSSSGVKEIAKFGGCVDDLVPAPVARRFAEIYPRVEA